MQAVFITAENVSDWQERPLISLNKTAKAASLVKNGAETFGFLFEFVPRYFRAKAEGDGFSSQQSLHFRFCLA